MLEKEAVIQRLFLCGGILIRFNGLLSQQNSCVNILKGECCESEAGIT